MQWCLPRPSIHGPDGARLRPQPAGTVASRGRPPYAAATRSMRRRTLTRRIKAAGTSLHAVTHVCATRSRVMRHSAHKAGVTSSGIPRPVAGSTPEPQNRDGPWCRVADAVEIVARPIHGQDPAAIEKNWGRIIGHGTLRESLGLASDESPRGARWFRFPDDHCLSQKRLERIPNDCGPKCWPQT